MSAQYRPERTELYEYDNLDRLRGFARGVSDGEPEQGQPPTQVTTPLIDADLASAQTWTNMDRRGNWRVYDYTLDQASVNQTRTRNGVNEYLAIDPDGPGGPLDAVTLVYDDNGNLTLDPLAPRPGDDPNAPSGQGESGGTGVPPVTIEQYRLTAVRDASAQGNPVLLEIVYDALGRRMTSVDYLAETTGNPCHQGSIGVPPVTVQHIYSGAAAIAEYQTCDGGARTLVREFLWGERFPEPLAMITDGGQDGGVGGPGVPAGETAYHYLHDALGTVVALTDPNGVEVERYACDPYGKTIIEEIDPQTGEPLSRSAASAYGSPFIWTGQRYDGGVGLYQFLFRSYSPRLGRWLQRDPAGYVDGVSLLEYASSTPAMCMDPLGLQDGTITHAHGDGWRVESEVFNSNDPSRANGNVHVQMDGEAKIYYDPTKDEFTYEGARPISKSLNKTLRSNDKLMQGIRKGVNRVRMQAHGHFSLGPKRGIVTITFFGWIALDIMFGYLELANCPYFLRFLEALRRGDIEEADRLHEQVRDWMIDHNLEKAALDFDYRWVWEWLPEIGRHRAEKQKEKDNAVGDNIKVCP